jgi:GntR family transcriptional regulator / MocR family aminotransferase
VAIYGLAPYRLSSEGRGGVIFGYATLDEPTIRRGVGILAQVVDDLRRRPAARARVRSL